MEFFIELMKNADISRSVLDEFIFGTISRLEIVKWVQEKYPEVYEEVKKNMESENKIEDGSVKTARMTAEAITAFPDRVENYSDSQKEEETVTILKKRLKELLQMEQHLDEIKYISEGMYVRNESSFLSLIYYLKNEVDINIFDS